MSEDVLKNVPTLDPEETVVLKKFNWKDVKTVRNLVTSTVIIDPKTKEKLEKVTVNAGDMQEEWFIRGIKSSPFFPEDMDIEERRKQMTTNDKYEWVKLVDYLFPKIQEKNNMEQLQQLQKK